MEPRAQLLIAEPMHDLEYLIPHGGSHWPCICASLALGGMEFTTPIPSWVISWSFIVILELAGCFTSCLVTVWSSDIVKAKGRTLVAWTSALGPNLRDQVMSWLPFPLSSPPLAPFCYFEEVRSHLGQLSVTVFLSCVQLFPRTIFDDQLRSFEWALWELIKRMTCLSVLALRNLSSNVFNDWLLALIRNDSFCRVSKLMIRSFLYLILCEGMK